MDFPKRGSGLVVLFLLLLGCASSGQLVRLSGLAVHPQFDDGQLERGGIAVLGFEQEAHKSDVARDALDYPIYRALHAAFPRAAIVGAKTVRRHLSVHASASPGQATSAAVAAGAEHDAALKQLSLRTRLLVSATLLSNEVIETDAETDEAHEFCRTRAIAVRYSIRDLLLHEDVWRGDIREQAQACNENRRNNSRKSADDPGGFFASLLLDVAIDSATDAMYGTYPAAPALETVARRAAVDFASVLPGALSDRR